MTAKRSACAKDGTRPKGKPRRPSPLLEANRPTSPMPLSPPALPLLRATSDPTPTLEAPGATLAASHCRRDPHAIAAGGDTSTESQPRSEAHARSALGSDSGGGQASSDTHARNASAGYNFGDGQRRSETQPLLAVSGYLELRVWAEMFADHQQERIRQTNRAERGGVDPAVYQAALDDLDRTEHAMGLAMARCYRRVIDPEIIMWQRRTAGIGEHLLARILGHVGHPVQTAAHHWEGSGAERVLIDDGPMDRRVSDLWSYCGHGDPERRKTKGMSAEEGAALGNPQAKMLVHLLAEACMKCTASPYREVYDQARERYADRTHAAPCVRCGPSGKPAPEGSPWSAGHQHAAALRLVGKEILRDLWIIGRGNGGPDAA